MRSPVRVMAEPQVVGVSDDVETCRDVHDCESDVQPTNVSDDIRLESPSGSTTASRSHYQAFSVQTTSHSVASSASTGGAASDRPPTRESLTEQGRSGAEADVILVRRHEEETLMVNFRRWIKCFSCIVCLLTPAMLGILVWMMVEYSKYRKDDCDVPLQTWCLVMACIVMFNATLNRPGRNGSLMVRVFCLWVPDPEIPRQPPLRVRIYNAIVALFIFLWNIFGLCLVIVSGSVESEHPSCWEKCPGLYEAVKVYATINSTFTVFFYVNIVGFSRVLGILMRRGMLHTSRAAPKGTLEQYTEEVKACDSVFANQPTCPVCLEDYDFQKKVLRIKNCGHVFHKQCLQGWLNVNRNCPICRRDLLEATEPS